jgi:hypothetical protein
VASSGRKSTRSLTAVTAAEVVARLIAPLDRGAGLAGSEIQVGKAEESEMSWRSSARFAADCIAVALGVAIAMPFVPILISPFLPVL